MVLIILLVLLWIGRCIIISGFFVLFIMFSRIGLLLFIILCSRLLGIMFL